MARMMDDILSSATGTKRVVELPDADKNKDLYITVGGMLQKYNLGRWLCGGKFQVLPEGITFIQNDSFLKRMEDYHTENEKKENVEKLQARLTELQTQLTELQLKSAKREQILWIWGVISTTVGIVLGILQLL